MAKSGLIPRKEISRLCARLRRSGKKIVFTNGVFDILHAGHVRYLTRARSFGDVLVLGLNSDASVRRLKGSRRPLQSQRDRAEILLGLEAIDYVVIFGEDTPQKLIEQVRPHVLVKGADYKISEIVGADFVRADGGRVERVRLAAGRSSSRLIKLLSR